MNYLYCFVPAGGFCHQLCSINHTLNFCNNNNRILLFDHGNIYKIEYNDYFKLPQNNLWNRN